MKPEKIETLKYIVKHLIDNENWRMGIIKGAKESYLEFENEIEYGMSTPESYVKLLLGKEKDIKNDEIRGMLFALALGE